MSGNVTDDPQELILLARAGDAEALGHLLAMHDHYLTLLARLQIRQRLRGKIDPDDLVQETFLKACRDFAQFRGTSEAEWIGWLRQILAFTLANTVRRYYGTQGRDVNLERDFADGLDRSSQVLDQSLAISGSTPSQRAMRREQSVILADALSRLPESYREVIILSHLEGLRFPEVAKRMGRSVESVRSLWPRALAQLKAAVGGEV